MIINTTVLYMYSYVLVCVFAKDFFSPLCLLLSFSFSYLSFFSWSCSSCKLIDWLFHLCLCVCIFYGALAGYTLYLASGIFFFCPLSPLCCSFLFYFGFIIIIFWYFLFTELLFSWNLYFIFLLWHFFSFFHRNFQIWFRYVCCLR